MHKLIQIIAATILSLATATTVQAQQPQWIEITKTESGDRVFFDTASQVKLFDAGVKQNTFRTMTLATTAGRRSFRQRYQADCFKGTLALRGLDLMSNQGSLIREVPLERADRESVIPEEGTIAASIWRYACSQF
ncbi:hypothetical protein [Microcoleus sp. POL10_C6]|uniref:hypothetical protein n=1 Tax=Microcoleus sp. POL10_C6 TaxID=2818852 RepID=UPI002FD10672